MDEKMVSLRINDIPVTVPEGSTVLEAARSAGFNIPSLCFLKDINEIGACRICVVEVEGRKNLAPACKTVCTEGMVVRTHTPRVVNARRTVMELILSNHPNDCLTCTKNGHCELQRTAQDLGIREIKYRGETTKYQRTCPYPSCATWTSASCAAAARPPATKSSR